MAAQAAKPTPDPSSTATANERPVYKNPPRELYPKELLTHAFVPYGAAVAEGPGRARTPMEVEQEVLVPETPEPTSKVKGEGKKPLKGKKRKGEEDGEAPKKKHKSKEIVESPPKKPKKVKSAS
jgi:hypothetical protein